MNLFSLTIKKTKTRRRTHKDTTTRADDVNRAVSEIEVNSIPVSYFVIVLQPIIWGYNNSNNWLAGGARDRGYYSYRHSPGTTVSS